MSQNLVGIASINGAISSLDEAKISLSDRGFLFGHSLFETILVQNNTLINWELHFLRLINGCKRIFISPPNEQELRLKCEQVILAFSDLGFEERVSLKIIVSAGNGLDLADHSSDNKSNIYIICRRSNFSDKKYLNGIKLMSFKDERTQSLIDVKTCNYLYSFMCSQKAKENKFDDVIFKDSDYFYTECMTSSLIWFDRKFTVHSYTPGVQTLAGTSLTSFIEKLKNNNIQFSFDKFSEQDINHNCLGSAAISSVRGFVPVQQIDGFIFEAIKYKDFFIDLEKILK